MQVGGTICLQSRWYDASTFPRVLFRDCLSRRAGLLMHNKVRKSLKLDSSRMKTINIAPDNIQLVYVRPRRTVAAAESGCAPCWTYIGSANLSESAWYVHPRCISSSGEHQHLKLFLDRGRLVTDQASKQPKMTCRNWECGVIVPGSRAGHGGSAERVPVPMVYPGERYGPRRPWFNSSQPDTG